MLAIVAHHYVVNSGVLDCIDAQSRLCFKDFFLLLFGWGGKTGINCFVLITGYFMCTSNITKEKFFRLLGEVYFYNIIIYAVFFLSGYESFQTIEFIKVFYPFYKITDGFTACFLLFYLLIPFLNKFIHALTQKEHLSLLAWCAGVYVLLPSFAKANVVFNYITWFVILYMIASYIRLYPKKWFEHPMIVGFLTAGTLLLSWLSIIILAIIFKRLGKSVGDAYFFVSDTNKILAVTTAVSLFLFFRNLKMGYSKVINTVAASTFGVLTIHTNSNTMRLWLWQDVCNNVGAYKAGHVVIHAIVCVLAIYTVCTVIDMVRITFIEKPLRNALCFLRK